MNSSSQGDRGGLRAGTGLDLDALPVRSERSVADLVAEDRDDQ